MPRILISDAYEVVRRGLLRILQTRANLEVVAVARDGGDAIRMAVETKPDIVVIGYALPMINGVEVTRQIRARLPGTEILIFTNQEDVAVIDQLPSGGCARLCPQVRRERPINRGNLGACGREAVLHGKSSRGSSAIVQRVLRACLRVGKGKSFS